MNKRITLLFLLLLTAALLTGCAAQDQKPARDQGAYLTGATLDEPAPGSNSIFTVNVEKDGDPVGVDFRGAVTSGAVSLQLVDSAGKIAWQQTAGTGTFAINQLITPPAGAYKLGLAWEGAVKASYNLYWRPEKIEPPVITPVALIQGVGMILVALGFIVYAGIRRLGWRALLIGAAFWVVTVALKFVWAGIFNAPIYQAVTQALPGIPGIVLMDIYVGSLTGVFEVGVTYGILRLRRKRHPFEPWKTALSFGIGFGAVEALLLGISPLISVIAAMAAPSAIPLGALEQLAILNNPLWSITGVWERFFVIWVHVACNVLIFYSLAVGQKKWFWLSFGIKTLLDTVAAHVQIGGLTTSLGVIWITEGIMAVIGIFSWWVTTRLSHRYPAAGAASQSVEPQDLAPTPTPTHS